MNLDTDRIAVGDNLYDIRMDKYGTVTSVLGNSLRLKFDGTEMSYGVGGVTASGVRVLYWHKPAMNKPRKHGAEQNAAMQALIDAAEVYRDA